MLTVYGSGQLKNFGTLKVCNIPGVTIYELFSQQQFGKFVGNSAGDGIFSLPDGKVLIGANADRRVPRFFSGSVVYQFYAINNNGSLDVNANTSIQSVFSISQFSGCGITSQSDGKIIAGGDVGKIARFNSDLSVDSSFDSTNNSGGIIQNVAVNSDGKIIIVGSFAAYKGSTYEKIVRLNSNGSIDTSFNPGHGFSSGSARSGFPDVRSPIDLKFQSDGKLVVVGNFYNYYVQGGGGIYTRSGSVRINTDGTIDQDFKNNTGSNGPVWSVDIQDDGKIIMAGSFTSYSGSSINRIVRTDNSGAIDPTFNVGTGFNNTVYKAKILSDGKILAVGSFTSYSGSTSLGGIVKLNSDGTIDNSFITNRGFSGSMTSVATFNAFNFSEDVSTNKIYVTGEFSNYSGSSDDRYFGGLIRLNSNGSADSTFNSQFLYRSSQGGTSTNFSTRVKKQSDGKYVIVGQITSHAGIKKLIPGILRVNSDFTYDPTFNPGNRIAGVFSEIDGDLTIRSDGKIILVGDFTSYSGSNNTNRIVSINSDGTKDNTFNTGSGLNSNAYTIALQSDDKVIVGGAFTAYSGSNTNRIVRINTNGTKDNTFNTGSGFNSTPYAIQVQTDGKILVGGNFTNYSGSGISCSGSVRLNSDGTVDTSFNVGSGFKTAAGAVGTIRSILSQSDGKIVMAGAFASYSGSSIGGMVRLNSDGTIDTSFNSGGSGFAVGTIVKVFQKSDGGYIVLSNDQSTTYNGSDVSNYTALTSNGSYDYNINVIGDASGGDQLGDIVQLEDGNLVLFGEFYIITSTFPNALYYSSIAKLTPQGIVPSYLI